MIYINHYEGFQDIRKNSFYRVNMVHPNGNQKLFNILGEGLENVISNYRSGGYNLVELIQVS